MRKTLQMSLNHLRSLMAVALLISLLGAASSSWALPQDEDDTAAQKKGRSGADDAVLEQKLPPRVSKFLSELDPLAARAMLGAFNDGYTIVKKLGDGFVLAKRGEKRGSASEQSVTDADFIISFNVRQKNKKNQSYYSVITQGGFQCGAGRFALLYQQFQADVFGTGASVAAYESSGPAHFRSLSKGLGDFLTSVYCFNR